MFIALHNYPRHLLSAGIGVKNPRPVVIVSNLLAHTIVWTVPGLSCELSQYIPLKFLRPEIIDILTM